MPMVSSLKSSRACEKKALIKEENDTQKLLQAECGDILHSAVKHLISVEKVLMNLEVKLGQLESVNKKLIEAYEQSEDQEGAEQFQNILDEEAELIDSVLTRISKLKILKGKVEQQHSEIEMAQSRKPDSSSDTE